MARYDVNVAASAVKGFLLSTCEDGRFRCLPALRFILCFEAVRHDQSLDRFAPPRLEKLCMY